MIDEAAKTEFDQSKALSEEEASEAVAKWLRALVHAQGSKMTAEQLEKAIRVTSKKMKGSDSCYLVSAKQIDYIRTRVWIQAPTTKTVSIDVIVPLRKKLERTSIRWDGKKFDVKFKDDIDGSCRRLFGDAYLKPKVFKAAQAKLEEMAEQWRVVFKKLFRSKVKLSSIPFDVTKAGFKDIEELARETKRRAQKKEMSLGRDLKRWLSKDGAVSFFRYYITWSQLFRAMCKKGAPDFILHEGLLYAVDGAPGAGFFGGKGIIPTAKAAPSVPVVVRFARNKAHSRILLSGRVIEKEIEDVDQDIKLSLKHANGIFDIDDGEKPSEGDKKPAASETK